MHSLISDSAANNKSTTYPRKPGWPRSPEEKTERTIRFLTYFETELGKHRIGSDSLLLSYDSDFSKTCFIFSVQLVKDIKENVLLCNNSFTTTGIMKILIKCLILFREPDGFNHI